MATATTTTSDALYTPAGPVHGQWDPAHTTTYGIVYGPDTAPTPWPFLAASLALSVVSGLIGCASDFMIGVRLLRKGNDATPPPKDTPWGLAKLLLKGPTLLVSTVRAFALLVATAKAQAQHGGRFSAPSVLVVFFLSLLPYATDTGAPHAAINAIAALDMTAVFVRIIITSYRGYFFSQPLHAYGKFFGVGGNCARTIQDCNGATDAYDPGCWLKEVAAQNATDPGMAFSSGRAYILYQEFAWTIMIHLFALLFLAFLILGCGGCMDRKRWRWNWRRRAAEERAEETRQNEQGQEQALQEGYEEQAKGLSQAQYTSVPQIDEQQQQLETQPKSRKEIRSLAKTYLYNIPLLLMLVFSGATFTAHYFQETREKPITVLDSFGPPQLNSDANVTSWTDCFQISLPVDKYGFWDEWYASQKGRVENLIALT